MFRWRIISRDRVRGRNGVRVIILEKKKKKEGIPQRNTKLRPNKIVWSIKVSVTKPNNWTWIPRTHMVERGKITPHYFSFDLHTYQVCMATQK